MQNKSDLSLNILSVAPSEQRTLEKDCYTESIFQSSPPKKDSHPNRFSPIRNTSFQSLSTITGSRSINSSSSIKDFTSRQDSKIVQINVYQPLLDPELQNNDNERSSDSDSDVETATGEEYQGKQDSVQVADNESDVFRGEEVQPVFRPVGKSVVQTETKTSPIAQTEVIKKQFTDNDYNDKMTTKRRIANITNIKFVCDKFTSKCYLAKTWLKVAFNTKSKQDDSKAKWKSVDYIKPIRLREYENNRISRSLENFTGYTVKAHVKKETTPIEPHLKTPIFTSQATFDADCSNQLLLESSVIMSPQMKDIMVLCDESFYGN
ncbi:hypothetical protein K501DRAFT_330635 [Backusella circina FSU 941]|nr:hypothetical protein K501DRAFT_330635 [Backusella circina FSU 941]